MVNDNKSYFETGKMIDTMIKTIDGMIRNRIKNISVDITKIGIITEIDAKINYKYKVKIESVEYSIPSATDQIYKVGDRVLVVMLEGNYNNKYIVGRAR